MNLLDYAIESTNEYIARMPKSQRKGYGQFFTSKETAVFMAELFDVPTWKNELRILDAGAGTGILSLALIEKLQRETEITNISITCYETDPNIFDLLRKNLDYACEKSVIHVKYEIKTENYILSQMLEYNKWIGANPFPQKYDLVIGNPPYMKVAKDSPEAQAMPDVCYGAPNLYFLFTSMGLFNLVPDGQLVYIIPRSWTSGAYFKNFRKKLLREGSLEHIHLFESRDKVFDRENVLQETMIIKVRKTKVQSERISITTTQSNIDFSNKTEFDAPHDIVISGEDCYVFLVTNEQEVEILSQLNCWKDTLPDLGMKMKTGLTIDFRNKDVLRNEKEEYAVPLFFPQHIHEGKVLFPIGKENEYIVTKQAGLLQKNANYLFVKRFTAKEEHRRLQCGVYLAGKFSEYEQISTQNKINFIDGLSGYSECVVFGLYVLFNSTLYDRYYRILNGSTQVNSTEVNNMPVPPLAIIEEMGRELISHRNMSEEVCDSILRRFINEQNRGCKNNPERIASAS